MPTAGFDANSPAQRTEPRLRPWPKTMAGRVQAMLTPLLSTYFRAMNSFSSFITP